MKKEAHSFKRRILSGYLLSNFEMCTLCQSILKVISRKNYLQLEVYELKQQQTWTIVVHLSFNRNDVWSRTQNNNCKTLNS